MKKANKKGEYPLASGTNVRNYLTEDSLKDLEEAGINVDFYVLKLCDAFISSLLKIPFFIISFNFCYGISFTYYF